MNMRMLWKFALFGVLLLPPACFARDVALIAQKDSTPSEITSVDLSKLLKTEVPKWPDGTKMVIFLGDPASTESHVLLQKIFKVAPGDVPAFLESHKDTILVMRSDDLVLKAVANRPGSIGVVNVYSINSAVKVLRLDGKLPLEQGYLLHGN